GGCRAWRGLRDGREKTGKWRAATAPQIGLVWPSWSCYPATRRQSEEGWNVKRLALLALLLAAPSIVAAPAPVPKPQRKAERPAVMIRKVIYFVEEVRGVPLPPVMVWNVVPNPLPPVQAPAQPPNADPPG